ncbi:MAG: S8 family serine peptidase [Verrucomicrobiota bacterium]
MTLKNRSAALFIISIFFTLDSSFATTLDAIGVTLLRTSDPTLVGTGVKVAQPEAPYIVESGWEVNPAIVGQPISLFTYTSINGSSSTYTNSLGSNSDHANSVGGHFYGTEVGVAPGVAHVDNYEASYFYQPVVNPGALPIQAKIVNQSFIFGALPPQTDVDSNYDKFASLNNTLFVSGVGNGGPPNAPATAYNGIGVGAFGGASSVGPTVDNGRSKPDITAPAGATSFSTPLVAGAAAILVQAGLRGDGGAGNTNEAIDIRTLKALLLNGAVKPTNWTHSAFAPLDTRFGTGILNVFNSYKQLAAGKFPFIESTTIPSGTAHPPGNNSSNIASLIGWDFNSVNSSVQNDGVNHYYFDLPAGMPATFTLTAMLVWNRQHPVELAINNLDFYLYNIGTSNLVASSVSTVDNVEHIFATGLSAGRYDLQVLKKVGLGKVSMSESYALAFHFFTLPLQITHSENQTILAWPVSPSGFSLQSTPDLNPPISWTPVSNTVLITNNQNQVTVPMTSAAQFFRLSGP